MGLPRTIGPYELVSLLGRGGMGVVYRARHTALQCFRAVKLIEGSDPQRTARFLREAGALARVRHANVVAVHEVGQEGPVLFFAMDLVEGGRSLDALIRDELPLERGLAIVEEAARGLHAVHEAGLVHRDVKPANIVVDGRGHAFVIDFGLVSSTEAERLTRTGVLVGTPAYFAPEYVLGLAPEPDPRVDVYALGAILYEIATGSTPIDAETPQEFFAAIASERPLVRPSTKRPGVPEGLDDVCIRALALRPEHRYATALQLATDLAELRAGKRPSHASSTHGARAERRSRSRRLVATLALALAVVATLVGVGWRVFARAARLEAAVAQARSDLATLEQRMRKPTAHPETDAPALEKLAAELATRAQEERALLGETGEVVDSLRGIAVRAELHQGELALWRHDLPSATRIRDRFTTTSFKSWSPPVGVERALMGGVAALTSPATTHTSEVAAALLEGALELEKDRGDLHLWSAVGLARLGQRAPARAHAQRAAMLGFNSKLETLVVLALTGDPEEARKAILAQPTLSDPAFAHPFVARATSLVAVHGAEAETIAAIREALRFIPPGIPELEAIARVAIERARPAAVVFGSPTVSLDTVLEHLVEVEPLVEIAHRAAPDLHDADLARATREAGVLQGNKGAIGSQARLRLATLGTLLDPDAVDGWIELALIHNAFHNLSHVGPAHEALAHAKLLARTARDRGAIACEECVADSNEEKWELILRTASAALDALEAATSRDEEVVRNQLYSQYGRALSHLARPEEMLAFCERAERHDYTRPLAQLRAAALAALGRPAEALVIFRACLSPEYLGDTDVTLCSKSLDELSRRLGRPLEELERDLARAENVASAGDDRRRLRLRVAAVQLERGKLEEARRTLEIARTGSTPDREPEIHGALGALDDPEVDLKALSLKLRGFAEN